MAPDQGRRLADIDEVGIDISTICSSHIRKLQPWNDRL